MEVTWDFIFLILNKKWELKNVNNFRRFEIPENIRLTVQEFIQLSKLRKENIKSIEKLENFVSENNERMRISNTDNDDIGYLVTVGNREKVMMTKSQLINHMSSLNEKFRELIQANMNGIKIADERIASLKQKLLDEYERFIDDVIENS